MPKKTTRKPDPFDVALWGLLVAIAVGAIYYLQLLSMRDSVTQQVHAIRVDQRAWMNVRSALHERVDFKEGETLSIPLQISNTGKTPASHVEAYIFSDYLPSTTTPQFTDRYALKVAYGFIMQNSPPVTISVSPTHLTPEMAKMPNPVSGIPIKVTPDVNKALTDGTQYVATFGFLVYDDIFHKHHRFQFCTLIANDPFHWTDTAQPCVDYNKIDEEEE